MPFLIVRDDITKMHCDAIVNPTNQSLEPGGSLDDKIHQAAGQVFSATAKALAPLPIGEAKPSPAFDLPCRYVIHTCGPVWQDGRHNEETLLARCYRNSLAIARVLNCETVAIPLISSGTNGFDKTTALEIASREISCFIKTCDMTVYLVVYERREYEISRCLFASVDSYLDRTWEKPLSQHCYCNIAPIERRRQERIDPTLTDRLNQLDKGFAETLFGYIDAKGISDVECYKRSNVDKKTFSKIKCNPDYRPSKITAVSFAIGLKLSLKEANHLLSTVGMTLSHSYRFDVIIEYFLSNGAYSSIHDVNAVLFEFDEPLLGTLN